MKVEIVCKDKEAVKAVRPLLWARFIRNTLLMVGGLAIFYGACNQIVTITTNNQTNIPGE